MNKTVILFFATVGGIGGGFVPALWGDNNFFGGMSILLGLIGGIAGIFVGVWVSNRWLS
jgi:hypothetical protein